MIMNKSNLKLLSILVLLVVLISTKKSFSQNSCASTSPFPYEWPSHKNWFVAPNVWTGSIVNMQNGSVTTVGAAGNGVTSYEGVSAASDDQGNLLFYTNGRRLWTGTGAGAVLKYSGLLQGNENGSTGNNGSASQGVITVRHPLNPDRYYVLTTDDAQSATAGLNYFVFDKLGNLLSGPTRLGSFRTSEGIAATKHENGVDIWVTIMASGTNNFHTFLLTCDGFVSPAVVSGDAPYVDGGRERGGLAFSFDGQYFAQAHANWDPYNNMRVSVYRFNKATGQIYDVKRISDESAGSPYDLTFSPNSNRLYISQQSGQLRYYDLSSWNEATIRGSFTSTGVSTSFSSIEIGVGGTLYLAHGVAGGGSIRRLIGNLNSATTFSTATYSTATSHLGLPTMYLPPAEKPVIQEVNQLCTTDDPIDLSTTWWCSGQDAEDVVKNPLAYRGPGITNQATGIFNPALAGIGTHEIIFQYCEVSDTVYIEVVNCIVCEVDIQNTTPEICIGQSLTLDSYVLNGSNIGNWTIDSMPVGIAPTINIVSGDTIFNATNLNVTSGLYKLKYTVTDGSETCYDTLYILINPLPSPNLGADVTICADANEVIFDAGAFTSYSWNTGATTQTIQTKTAGEYIVTVTDANGCEASDTVNLIVNPLPTPNLGADVTICADANEVIFDAGAFTSYAWSTGATTQTIQTKTAGEYIVTVTDANGCEASDTVNLIVNPLPTPNLGADITICADANEVNFDAGAFTSYAWSTGATTQTIQTKTAGEYIVTVTDANGCEASDTVNLVVNSLPSPNLGADVTICVDANEVNFDAGAFTSYAWNTGATTQTIQTKTAGEYIVTVTDANGCSKNDTVNLIVNLLPTPNLGNDTAICIDANEVTFDAGTFTTYAWNTGASTQTIQTKTAGEYIITVIDANGCEASDTVNLVVNALPTPNLGADITICADANEVIFDAGAFTSYDWSTGATTQTIQTKTSGEYIVTVTDVNGCEASDTVNLVVNPLPTPNLGNDIAICIDANEVNFDAGTFNTYAWNTGATSQTIQTKTAGEYIITVIDANGCEASDTVNLIVNPLPSPNLGADVTICADANEVNFDAGTFTSYAWNTGATSQTIQTKTAGEYIITVIDANGCEASDTVNLVVNPLPTPNLGADVTICADANEVNFDAGTFTSYAWNTGAATQTIQTKIAGEYIITVTDANGCEASDTVNLILNPLPTPNLGNDTAICIDANEVTFDAGTFTSYAWSTGATTQTIQTKTAGEYIITVIDANGCEASDTVNLIVKPMPTPNLGTDVTICADANEVIFDAGAFTTYSWNTGASTQTIQTKTAGEYIVTVTDANGCNKNDTVNLIVNQLPTPTLQNDTAICIDANEVTFDAGTFTSYAWNTGATTQTIQTKTAGEYIVTVTDANGCSKNDTVNLIVNQLPTPTLQNDTAICIDAPAITLNPGNYVEYLWSTAATSTTIDVNTAGQYIVGVKDINGCVASDTFNLSIKTLPIVDINDITVCPNINANFDAGTFTAYLWHDGSTNATFSTTDSIKVWVTVTDNNGCKNTDTARVFIKNQLDVNLGADIEICLGEDTILNAGNLYNNPTYVWSTSETTQTISVNTSGEYFVEVTDQDGCKGYDTLNVIVHNLPTPSLQNDTAICIDAPAITLNPGNYVEYLWNTAATSTTIDVNMAGEYIVEVKDINGCVASDTFNLSINTLPIVDINDITVCPNINANFDAGTFTAYLWHDGSTNATFSTTDSIKVWVTVTDNYGCKNTDTARVFIKNQLDVNLGADIEICLGEDTILNAGNLYNNPTYVWNTSAQTQTISVNTSGEYFVEVTDQDGCKGYDTLNVIVHNLPTPSLQNDTAICIDAPAITLNPGNYVEYLWSTAATTSTIDVNTAGQYIVGVKDFNGCVASDTFNLSINTLPIVDINDITVCPNINANFDAGTFTAYLWHDGSTNATFSTTDSVKVWVTVTDNNGCKNTDTARVFIKNQLDVNLGADIEICLGEDTILNAGNLYNNPTYVWSTSETTQTISVNTSGEYFVEVTDQDGCKGYDTLNVIVHNLPTPSLQNDTAICIDAPAITLNPGNYVEYLWSTAATTSTIDVNTAGEYIVGVKDINGCIASDTFNLSINTLPIVDINDRLVCPGVTANFNAGNFSSYLWQDGSTNSSFTTTDSTKVWVVVTDNNGCKNSDTAKVVILEKLKVELGNDTAFCAGNSFILNCGYSATNYGIVWSSFKGTNAIEIPNIENLLINETGRYSVEITDQYGCKGSDTVNVLVNENPTIEIGNDVQICENTSHEFSIPGTWNQIEWSNGANTANLEVNNTGEYWVKVTDNNNCVGKDTVELTVHNNPTPNIGNDQWICPDETATFNAGNFISYLWHDGSTASTYTSGDSSLVWVEVRNQFNCVGRDTSYLRIHPRLIVDLGPDQEICAGESYTIQTELDPQNHTFTWNNNSTTNNLSVNQSGTFTVNVTHNNGCKATDDILITVNANPTPNVTDVTVCEGTAAVLDGGIYDEYEWRLSGQSNILGTNQTFNPITEGVYSLTVTDSKGCSGTTQVTVNVTAKPVIPVLPDLYACEGQNVLAQPNLPNGSVLWSNGSNSRSQFLNNPGKYWITVFSSPNCYATDTFDFIWRDLPEVDLGDDFGFCIGETRNISVPNGYSSVVWNTGAKNNTITVSNTGTYSVTVTDNFGCVGSGSVNVNVSNLPNFTRTPNQVVCFEEIGSLDLEVNSGVRSIIFWEHDFSTGNKLNITSASPYIFTVTNNEGCSKSDTIQITERCEPRIFVPNAITPNDDGLNDYFTAKGIAIRDFEMYIFNRWGEEIFYTNDIETGWNGYYKGEIVQIDVYVYKIYYTLDDQTGDYKREQMVGTVTVLR
jgi:gliding motility-associated-like protein